MYPNSENASRFEKPVTAAYYLAYLSEGLVTSIFGASMVYFAGRAGCTVAEISSVLILYNLGFIFSSLFLVALFDRLPGNRMLSAAIFAMIAVLVGLSFARVRWLLLVIAGVMGIANAIVENGPNILFPWMLGEERARRPVNILYLFYSIGCVITPLLIGIALKLGNTLTPVFALIGVVILIPAVMLLRLPGPRNPRTSEEKGAAPMKNTRGEILAACAFGLMLFFYSSGLSTLSNWTATVLIKNGLTDEASAAMMASVLWLGSFVGRAAGAWLSGKMNPSKIVTAGLIIVILDGICMYFCRGSLFLIGACVFINGFAGGPVIANTLAVMKQRGLVSALINGIVLACSQVGCMVLPTIFGRLYGDSPTSYTPFVTFTLCASIAQFAVMKIVERER